MVAKYPDDLEAATMFAESLTMLRPWQLWSLDGELTSSDRSRTR